MPKCTRWGFGMAPMKKQTEQKNKYALMQVKELVLGEGETFNRTLIADEISIVKGMFNRIVKQDQWDWFTVNMYLDYPCLADLNSIVPALANLRKALLESDSASITKSIEKLKLYHFIEYCNNYLSFDINAETEEEYLYILSRREEKDILKIGMTTRNIQKRVSEINSATGVLFPYSARKVYKVKNCRKVERDVHILLSEYRIRADREFFSISFGEACSLIEKYLAETHEEFYGA